VIAREGEKGRRGKGEKGRREKGRRGDWDFN